MATARGGHARVRVRTASAALLVVIALTSGCERIVQTTDRDVAAAIQERQRAALRKSRTTALVRSDEPVPSTPKSAYEYVPRERPADIPPDFEAGAPAERAPSLEAAMVQTPAPASAPTSSPAPVSALQDPADLPPDPPDRLREREFTLTDALAYAGEHRRELQSAKEDLYLVALALTLERHLWTPIFAGSLRQVYGNFGEITNFDQAARFVADLSVAQRLPYGGEFTAKAISTLIRDIKRDISAVETGQVELGLRVPFLRGAGHVARERLIQLERELTYAVRAFERFRRQQLVEVATRYFDLLRTKQAVLDAVDSVKRSGTDFQRAQALEQAGSGTQLDTRRAQQRALNEQNRLARLRESFRAATDRFKLVIGMPVDEPIGLGDLETIDAIEQQILAGLYPLLRKPPAATDEQRAVDVAVERRLDLQNRTDQVDDARRGVAVAKNALLPDLDWTSTLTFDSDPEHYNIGALEVARATWRTEMLLNLPLERTAERNQFRAALIDVNRAQRVRVDLAEQIRAQVREAANQIDLQEQLLAIQVENLEVARLRLEFARIQFNDGDLEYRDLDDAETELVRAQNELNAAKTDGWSALLQFRIATETLRVEDSGQQLPDPAVDPAG